MSRASAAQADESNDPRRPYIRTPGRLVPQLVRSPLSRADHDPVASPSRLQIDRSVRSCRIIRRAVHKFHWRSMRPPKHGLSSPTNGRAQSVIARSLIARAPRARAVVQAQPFVRAQPATTLQITRQRRHKRLAASRHATPMTMRWGSATASHRRSAAHAGAGPTRLSNERQ